MTSQPQAGTAPSRSLMNLLAARQAAEAQSSSTKPKGRKNKNGLTDPTPISSKAPGEQAESFEMLERIRLEQKKQEWASWVNEEFAKCKNARLPFERQWYINLAFVNGKHYVSPVEVPGQGFRLTAPRAPAWRVRLTINKCRTAVRRECSKLSSSRPIPTVVPATNEDEDYSAARVAEQILKNAFATADFLRTYRSWIWWGSVTGVSYMKSYWSPNEMDPDLHDAAEPIYGADGQPLMGHDGKPMLRPVEPTKGRIMVERITPFHIFVPDLLAEDINKQPYVMHVTTRSPIWVQKNFGFKPTTDTRAANTIMESAMLLTKGQEAVHDSVLVKEVWLKKEAHPDFPEGGLITVINDKVVQYKSEWPWPFPEYPFYKYDGIPTGSFYADSMLVDLIPLNKEYNRSRSQMIEIKNTMGRPKFIYPKGSVNMRQISSEPGQGIPYTPGFDRPTIIPGTEVPASFHQELERLNIDFDDISGQHEVSRGGTPGSVSSGTAIAFLQEQDDVMLTFPVGSIEYAIEMLGKHYLKYAAQYWTEARLLKITGKDSNFEALHWKGSDLRGNTDVRIQTGSALPVSKAARVAMLTEFMQYGWIDPTTGLEMLDLGGLDKVLEGLLIDKKQAQRENLKMAELDPQELEQLFQTFEPPKDEFGQPVIDPFTGLPEQADVPEPPIPVNSWDNHEAHIEFHNQFRKTQQFEMLDDNVKKAFEQHVQMHQQAIQSSMIGEMGMMGGEPVDPAMQASQEMELQGQAQGLEHQGNQNNLQNALMQAQIAQVDSSTALNQKQLEAE